MCRCRCGRQLKRNARDVFSSRYKSKCFDIASIKSITGTLFICNCNPNLCAWLCGILLKFVCTILIGIHHKEYWDWWISTADHRWLACVCGVSTSRHTVSLNWNCCCCQNVMEMNSKLEKIIIERWKGVTDDIIPAICQDLSANWDTSIYVTSSDNAFSENARFMKNFTALISSHLKMRSESTNCIVFKRSCHGSTFNRIFGDRRFGDYWRNLDFCSEWVQTSENVVIFFLHLPH